MVVSCRGVGGRRASHAPNTVIVGAVDGSDHGEVPTSGFHPSGGGVYDTRGLTGRASEARRAGGRRRPHWYAGARGVASQKGGGPVPSSSYQDSEGRLV